MNGASAPRAEIVNRRASSNPCGCFFLFLPGTNGWNRSLRTRLDCSSTDSRDGLSPLICRYFAGTSILAGGSNLEHSLDERTLLPGIDTNSACGMSFQSRSTHFEKLLRHSNGFAMQLSALLERLHRIFFVACAVISKDDRNLLQRRRSDALADSSGHSGISDIG